MSHDAAEFECGTEDKSKKYDRQLRLWGDHGQAALEMAKVCLINANSTGTEILKNLILPGVGSFTIVDGCKVSGEHVGNNFFLDKDSIGKSRACVATELLLELNEDVSGDYVDEGVDDLLDANPTFFNNFNIVIACQLPEKVLLRLASELWDHDVPLLVCRSYGFVGYMRIVTKEHTIVESHPDNALEDLRLDRPFPGLIQFCSSLDLNTMSKKDHSHTPWLVIIYKYLEVYKEKYGSLPKTYKEKSQFKELIRTGIRTNADGVPETEENFDEALRNCNTALVQSQIPSSVREIFSDECCVNLHSESKPFWILARAVKEFVENEGQGLLPLRGSIPDMTSDSDRFIRLQSVYKDQATQDISVVSHYIQNLLQSLGRDEPLNVSPEMRSPGSSPGQPQDNITDTDIKIFCRNASFLQVLRCRSLAEEYNVATANTNEIGQHLEDMGEDDILFYVMLRAVDRFQADYNRYPGCDDGIETDVSALKSCVCKLLQEWGLPPTLKDEFVHELYGAAELHSVAAYMGGCAAQEAIKVITSQFVPINNTYIYNAMKQTSVTVQL